MVHKMQTGWQESKLLTAELMMLPGGEFALNQHNACQLIEPVGNTVERKTVEMAKEEHECGDSFLFFVVCVCFLCAFVWQEG